MASQAQFPNLTTDPSSGIAEFEQILLSNSGEDAFESAIKLLAAKLMDEIAQSAGESERFKQHETTSLTYEAIQDLYTRAITKWPLLGGSGNELGISPQHLARSIRPLLGWRLEGSDLSWLDATLERLVARDSKGALGQYFTPRDIVQLCVDVLNPQPRELVIDPACGSGSFLLESVRHSRAFEGRSPQCLGIDFSPRSVKVASLLAAALKDDSVAITNANSIDGRSYSKVAPKPWKGFSCQDAASNTKRAKQWGDWNKLGCDVVLTNPPFAGDIDDADVLDAYEAQQDRAARKTVSREHLFLERAVDLLKPGGRLAIVLPQGILANSSSAYLRKWLLKKCRLVGVIGLHQHAFIPYTGVKTAIVFLAKPTSGEILPPDYPIFFSVSRSAGKDGSGRISGVSDYPQIAAAFKAFIGKQKLSWASKVRPKVTGSCEYEIIGSNEAANSDRLDAEHFDPTARSMERQLTKRTDLSVANLVESKIPRFRKKSYKEISYLDISSVDKRTGLTFPSAMPADEAPSRASYLVSKGDVLVSTVRPESNVVALVTSELESPTVASNGFCVLRSKEIAPEVLFSYCKTEAFRRILSTRAAASMYPTVGDRDILGIPFLSPPDALAKEIVDAIRSGFEMIELAHTRIQDAVALMDDFVSNASKK